MEPAGYRKGLLSGALFPVHPITPDEVLNKHKIPPVVFEVINQLIVKNWDKKTKTAFISQEDAQNKLCETMKITDVEMLERKLLFIEADYRKAGWYVEYKKFDADSKFHNGFLFSLEP